MKENQENEKSGFVVAYDLPSENRIDFSAKGIDKEVKDKVRSVRISATIKLHKLGVLSTESVILVPSSNEKYIQTTINEINKMYSDLDNWLRQKGLIGIEQPLIKVIELTKKQVTDYKELAQRKLKQRLDEAIDRLAKLLNEIDQITDSEKRKRLRYNLNKQKKEMERIEQISKELGINLEGEFGLFYNLLNNAINELKGGEI